MKYFWLILEIVLFALSLAAVVLSVYMTGQAIGGAAWIHAVLYLLFGGLSSIGVVRLWDVLQRDIQDLKS